MVLGILWPWQPPEGEMKCAGRALHHRSRNFGRLSETTVWPCVLLARRFEGPRHDLARRFRRSLISVTNGRSRRRADIADRRWTSRSSAVQRSPRDGKILPRADVPVLLHQMGIDGWARSKSQRQPERLNWGAKSSFTTVCAFGSVLPICLPTRLIGRNLPLRATMTVVPIVFARLSTTLTLASTSVFSADPGQPQTHARVGRYFRARQATR